MYLSQNKIGDRGAQYLADALQSNTVTHIILSLATEYPATELHIDTHSHVART